MKTLNFLSSFCLFGFLAATMAANAEPSSGKPNILIIYADDLGYGEVSAYNPSRNKIPTPNIDRLASRGMVFTDAHSSSSVCSPSRYSLLTGRYHWRSRLGSNIVGRWGSPAISPDRLTLASMVRQHGYQTAIAGKWHLGWDWNVPREKLGLLAPSSKENAHPTPDQITFWNELFSKDIAGGPVDRGFERYFGTDVPNWPPFCFIENRRTRGIPNAFLPADMLKNNQASVAGPALENWSLEPILPAITTRACQWIEEYAGSGKPFFLYFPMTAPHTPIAPNKEWQGKSGLGNYGDFVFETDAAVGRVLEALEKSGVSEQTLVIFSSDNGHAPYAGGKELEKLGHFPSGPLRGYKFDAWEGGHRVPFIVRWPGKFASGSRCHQLVHQADVFATVAEILGHPVPANAGEDSFSFLPLLKEPNSPVREIAVSQSPAGTMALRRGSWKMIFGPGGRGEKKAGNDPGYLFNLSEDPGEERDLRAANPGMVAELTRLMQEIIGNGRSTPGEKQENDIPVHVPRLPNP